MAVIDAKPLKRGYLIAIEGCDRAGKSTQCQLLMNWLATEMLQWPQNKGCTDPASLVQCWKFPDRTTPLGKIINAYLTGKAQLPDESIHLLFSANRWEQRDKMIETLQSGTSIVLDRYVPSGVAYTAAKGLDIDWCKAPDAGLPKPDLVLFIDLPSEVAQARAGYGEERYEKAEFQAKVRQLFHQLEDDTWAIIHGNQTPEDVAACIKDTVTKRNILQTKCDAPINSI